MGILDIETGGFHGFEGRLDFPSSLICMNSVLRSVEAYENLELRHTVGVLYSTSGKIHILSFMNEGLPVELLLSDLEIIEEPPGPDPLTPRRLDYPEILPDPDIIPDPQRVEPSNPFLAYEFPVSHKAIYTFFSKKTDESLHNVPALLPIGVAALGKELEYQWERYPFVCDSQHEDIYVDLPEFPIGAVYAQDQACPDRKQDKNHACDDIEVEGIIGKESLKPAQVGFLVDRCRHGGRKLMETHSLDHAECVQKEGHKFYTRHIHCLSKMLLHNWEDLINFVHVLGNSSFHEKKWANFSLKLLIFKDFCKYNQLKIRCLTACF